MSNNLSRPRGELSLTATVNTRVAPSTRLIIDTVASREGISIRDIVEQAIAEKWGPTMPAAADHVVSGAA